MVSNENANESCRNNVDRLDVFIDNLVQTTVGAFRANGILTNPIDGVSATAHAAAKRARIVTADAPHYDTAGQDSHPQEPC